MYAQTPKLIVIESIVFKSLCFVNEPQICNLF